MNSVVVSAIRRMLGAGALIIGIAGLCVAGTHQLHAANAEQARSETVITSSGENTRAYFGAVIPSSDARNMADWIAASNDNRDRDFVVIDKHHAQMYVFNGRARLRAATPVLLGSARGDHTVPGIGSRPLAQVRPEERTTPAGRFVAERGRNLRGEDVVWIDYDNAVSMHRVLTTDPKEQRLQRLASPQIDDNRISYGCINVPVAFYESYIRPIFANRRALVYVLPEVQSLGAVFHSFEAAQPIRPLSQPGPGVRQTGALQPQR